MLLAIVLACTSCVFAMIDQLHHYEVLNYSFDLHERHLNVRKRSTTLYFSFHAYNRSFHLELQKDITTFSPDVEISCLDENSSAADISFIYEGKLSGEFDSYIHGSIVNSVFSGFIETHDLTYYIERSEVFFRGQQPFHSIIYSERDISPKSRWKKRSVNDFGCGLSDPKTQLQMKELQGWLTSDEQNITQKHGMKRKINIGRSSRSSSYSDDARHICSLFLQTDVILWKYMTRPVENGGLGYDPSKAKRETISLLASMVAGVKRIYNRTVFHYQNMGPFQGISFVIHRIQINTSADCSTPYLELNPFCKPNIDIMNFLNLHSLQDHDLFCLAYIVTFREFIDGKLGLAYINKPNHLAGGVCERYKVFKGNKHIIHKSLNTGIVTLNNYASRVPLAVSVLTLAHEIGHNFGAEHDSGIECVPSVSDPDGNYIMFSHATSGEQPNNYKFSTCSINNITMVLHSIFSGLNHKYNCFIEEKTTFCGNRIVEMGEECDCGFDLDCQRLDVLDTCCFPEESPQKCRRKPGAQCSPSEGPCCVPSTCHFAPEPGKLLCYQQTECTFDSFCNGQSAICPRPLPKDNLTFCNSRTQVCIDGSCQGSVCLKIQWLPCSPSSFNRELLCFVSCLNPKTKQCVSTGDQESLIKPRNRKLLLLLRDMNVSSIQLTPGAPCDDLNGYCDSLHRCRLSNADGPLANLWSLLIDQQGSATFQQWISEFWWAAVLLMLVLVVLLALFIAFCSYHIPSFNPGKAAVITRHIMSLATASRLPAPNGLLANREPPR